MTQEQIIESDKAIKCLNDARKHLDTAMYAMGEIEPEEYGKLRAFYNAICAALDLV